MITRIPIVQSQSRAGDFIWAAAQLRDNAGGERLKESLTELIRGQDLFLRDSGIEAFYHVLCAARAMTSRDEVILPAYTAGSLVVAVRKAGLKPVLCDIAHGDASSFDQEQLRAVISTKTLAIVCVHLFGIAMNGIQDVRAAAGGAIVIEDCAQAMGTLMGGRHVGSFSDVSIYSFNRGKNIPAGAGGVIAVSNTALARVLREHSIRAERLCVRREVAALFKSAAFACGTSPLVYSAGHALFSCFKETRPPDDIAAAGGMARVHIGLARRLLQRRQEIFSRRFMAGARFISIMAGKDSVIIPCLDQMDRPVFNRIPVLFRMLQSRCKARQALWKTGIDSSYMYDKPLHHMFDLGYGGEEFPNACFYARRLLTLPVHPGVAEPLVERMAVVVSSSF